MADKRNNIIRDQKPGSRKLVHSPVAAVTPSYYQQEYPQLVEFLEKYFEYIEDTAGFGDLLQKLKDIRNIDVTEEAYVQILSSKEYGAALPDLSSIDETAAVRLFEYWYKAKGTRAAVEMYFRIFLNTNVEVVYPRENMLIVDGGDWDESQVRYTTVKSLIDEPRAVIQDDFYYQAFSYLIRSGQSISDWGDTFYRAAHAAGFKVFGEVELSGVIGNFNNIATNSPTIQPGFQTLDAEILILGAAAHAMGVSPQIITKAFKILGRVGQVDDFTFAEINNNLQQSTYRVYDFHETPISDFDPVGAESRYTTLHRPARIIVEAV